MVDIYNDDYYIKDNFDEMCLKIRNMIDSSVQLRMMRDDCVNIGVFLSGGLDSSLIASIALKYTNQLFLFSIGMNDGIDLKYARKVYHFLKKKYKNTIPQKEIIYVEKIFDKSLLTKNNNQFIKNIVYVCESFDETIRKSSIGNYLLAQMAKKNNCRVVLTGAGADELFGGYNYLFGPYYTKKNDICVFNNELIYSIQTMSQMALMRADRCSMNFGIEQRVPLLDTRFVDYVLRIDPKYKLYFDKDLIRSCNCTDVDTHDVKKLLLRCAFADTNILPNEILFRKKLQFSGGMGAQMYQIIQNVVNNQISDDELQNVKQRYTTKIPKNKAQIFYRKLFEQYFGKKSINTVYTWGNEDHEQDNKFEHFVANFQKLDKEEQFVASKSKL